MVPAGYMAKRVVARPDWLPAERVSSIYSVSGCVSDNFTDYITFWKHNGYWLFDSSAVITDSARENNIDLAETMLFFYEVYELQFNSGEWTPFEPEPSFGTNVSLPEAKVLEGYDVVTFYVQTSPECSPLSCNSLAAEVETDRCCLHRAATCRRHHRWDLGSRSRVLRSEQCAARSRGACVSRGRTAGRSIRMLSPSQSSVCTAP